jgi:hypothetical protein
MGFVVKAALKLSWLDQMPIFRLHLVMENEAPKRHGCLTAYLVFMLIINTLTALSYFIMGDKLMAHYPSAPSGIQYVFGFGGIVNVVIVLALFWWKKWAFYTFCVLAVVYFGINLYIGISPVGAILGLIGPLILYGVFQIGGERKGWKYLK